MNVKYINPFVNASVQVIRQLLPKGEDIEILDVYIKDELYSTHPVNVLISVSGEVRGKVTLGMDVETAMEISENMIGGAVDSFEEDAQSAIKELVTMISGNAMVELGQLNFDVNITPPRLFYGHKMPLTTFHCPLAVTIPIRMSAGLMELNLSLIK